MNYYYVVLDGKEGQGHLAASKREKDGLVDFYKSLGEVKVYKLTEIEHYDRKVT